MPPASRGAIAARQPRALRSRASAMPSGFHMLLHELERVLRRERELRRACGGSAVGLVMGSSAHGRAPERTGRFRYYPRLWRTPAQPCSRASPASSAAAHVLTAAGRRRALPRPTGAAATAAPRAPSCARVHRRSRRGRARVRRRRHADRAAGRQHRAVRRRDRRDAAGDEVVLSLARMNRVRAVDADNATITVEAGVHARRACRTPRAAAGMHFPLSLASEGSCTIGGNLSTNAGGTAVLRYGNTRELVLGLEVVLADGSVLDRAARPAQGQHRLRPEAAVHRRGRHARHHHRGGAEAVPGAAHARSPRWPRSRVGRRGHRAAARDCKHALGRSPGRLRAHERVLARPVAQAHPGLARPAARPSVVRAGAGRRQRGDAPLRRDGRRRRSPAPSKPARRVDATVAQSGEQAERAVGAAREHHRSAAARGSQHQARHLAAGVGDPGVPARTRERALAPRFPARASSCSGTWATATCTTTCRRPKASTRGAFMDQRRARATASCTTWWRATAAASAPSTASAS